MLGFKKKKEPTTTYERFRCKCGCDLFNNVVKLSRCVTTYPDGYSAKCIQAFKGYLACIMCGSLYSSHGDAIE